jgi:hypothetical protein
MKSTNSSGAKLQEKKIQFSPKPRRHDLDELRHYVSTERKQSRKWNAVWKTERKKQTWISRAPKGFRNREKNSKKKNQKKQPEEEEEIFRV